MNLPSRLLAAQLFVTILVAASCTSTSTNSGPTTPDSSNDPAAASNFTPSSESSEPEPLPDAATSTIDDTPTTPTESTPIPVIGLNDIPTLITRWGNADGEPLELARQIIGFPLEAAPPDGSTPFGLSVTLDGQDADADWTWNWNYTAIAAGASIGDIGAELPEGGPGTIETRLAFEPQLNALGFEITDESTSPSAGSASGQAAIFTFEYDSDTYRLGEINAQPVLFMATGDSDLDAELGGTQAGYGLQAVLEAQSNFIPVPLLESLFREVPVAPGARLTNVDFRSLRRPDTDPAATEGTRYFELRYDCELLPNSANAAHEVYSVGLEGSAYQVGSESADQPGFIEATEAAVIDGVWTQPVIVLDRYPGEITVQSGPDGAVSSTVVIRLEPNREPLMPISG